MNAGSLQMHLHNQHSVGWGYPNGNPPPRGVPLLPGFFLKDVGCVLMPGVGVSGDVNDPDQPPDPFCAPPRVGHTCDPGGG